MTDNTDTALGIHSVVDDEDDENVAIKLPARPGIGRGYRKTGLRYLKITFLSKFGWFCDDCRSGLLLDKLLDGSAQSSPTATGQSFQRPGQSVEIHSSIGTSGDESYET